LLAGEIKKMSGALLEAKNLKKYFPVKRNVIFSRKAKIFVKAVDGVSFSINSGETLSLVGDSGCGKTTICKLLLFLEELTAGQIIFHDKDISQPSKEDLKRYRSSVQAMFQDPYSSLNPRMKVGDFISEPIKINLRLNNKEAANRVHDILNRVKLDPACASLYPHEFSGGQRQRIALARAMTIDPSLLILDEPVSALDVSVRAQLMNLLMDIQRDKQFAYIIIAHDLATVRHMSNKMAVMYLGKIVEYGDSEAIFTKRLHPYSKMLFLAALPSRPGIRRERLNITGEIPSPINPPAGCRFNPRCSYCQDICTKLEPELINVDGNHKVACHRWREID
jgi:oligopeptide/dipeptide ABC transporter ATP-binding protein